MNWQKISGICRKKTSSGFPNREARKKSARAEGERFFVEARFGERRNTLCISSSPNRWIGGKAPASAAEDFFRVSPKKKGALRLLKPNELETLRQMARGLAAQFGSNCEVVVHEISERSTSHSVVAIENGHVSGRKLGDGPSQVVLEQLGKDGRAPEDQLCYLTRTPDGKLLKSSSIYIRDESGRVCAIFCINFDISALAMAEQALAGLTSAHPAGEETPRITHNVNDLLDDLIEQSDRLIGKPVALMSKEDKVRAIHFLNEHGALLVTKSGDKIAKHFGISKYTLYSYLDVKTGGKSND